ncbi:MAG: N-acyl-D-amino-acid deacylase [Candidatus Azotimanducaceae bacterium]|jgi:N-acyl-D-amino-acid deacylase
MHDLVIRNGLVVDGTGADPVAQDIAIDGNQIVAMGSLIGEGQREIDAAGHIVTPGFVDVHTHLDAQIGWDPMLTPISWHGVTTALLGNCGVTFAPCKPDDREFLAAMMETVEDIPREAIMTGLSWNWEHYGEYLDELDTLNPAINVAGMIGHCALRYYVMGERGVDQAPTEEEKKEMSAIVKKAIEDGAVGFSTSRFLGHYIPDGRHVPGTHAEHDELEAIAKVVGEKGGLMQNVTRFGSDFDSEMELIKKEGANARVLFSHGTGRTVSYGDKVEDQVMAMREKGMDVNAIAIPRSSGFVTGLQAYLPWKGGPWSELAELSFDERLEKIKDGAFVEKLVARGKERGPLIEAEQIFYLGNGDKPNYIGGPADSLQALADSKGEHPVETFIRLSLESEGKGLFTLRFFNQNMDALAKAITSEFCLPSLGDAGAHVSQIMDSGWATFVMTHWHRDSGLFTLPEVVRRLTSAPARIIGLKDRGTLAIGQKADINVINLEALSERMPEIVNDFPGGSSRFIQKARGYRATVCNGQVILENDQHTGARSGEVLRHVS